MARRTLQRKVTKTKVTYAVVQLIDGEAQVSDKETVTLLGKVTADRALHQLQRDGLSNVTVLEVNPFDEVYRISIDDFMKYATLVEE